MAKLDARLELRLNKRTYERLEQRAAAEHTSVAAVVRRAIESELVGDEGWGRRHLLEKGISLNVPVPDDPSQLTRELAAGCDVEAADAPDDPSLDRGRDRPKPSEALSRRRQ